MAARLPMPSERRAMPCLGFLEDSSPAGELVAGVPVLGHLRRSRRHGRQVTPLAADFSV